MIIMLIRIKEYQRIILSILFLVAFALTILLGGYKLNWVWTGFTGEKETYKTLYDWLQLLIIPLAIAIVGLWFSHVQKSNEQKISDDNQKEEALQGYINEMSTLLLEKNLRKSNAEDEASIIGSVRTLTVLRRLDTYRKKTVLEFLYESGHLQKDKCIIKLKKAYFGGVYLYSIDLHDANLRGAYLFGADLSNANLRGSNLSDTELSYTNLEGADLIDADLSNASMKNVYLKDALVTNEQLEKTKSLTYSPTAFKARY